VRDIPSSDLIVNPFLRQAGLISLLGVPLCSGGQAIGVLHIGSKRKRSFAEHETRTLEAIAQRMALAVEKANLLEEREEHLRELETAYRRERRIAEALQRSFLPEMLVSVPGLAVAHLYQAAMAEAEIGGDFYDVIELGNGLVGVVMGDVSGKGLDAAVFTALTKYTLRGYALEESEPSRVLQRLNRAFYYQSSEETFATLFFCIIDLASGHLSYASAGHEPALHFEPESGRIERLCSTGPASGVLPEADYQTVHQQFSDHDMLLLYTDGVSDARRDDEFLGIDGLEQIVARCVRPDLQDSLACIYESILRFSRDGLRDDTALMLLRRRPEELPP
jgi:serine phosphatase RsbU (regulator of sigma subunit)